MSEIAFREPNVNFTAKDAERIIKIISGETFFSELYSVQLNERRDKRIQKIEEIKKSFCNNKYIKDEDLEYIECEIAGRTEPVDLYGVIYNNLLEIFYSLDFGESITMNREINVKENYYREEQLSERVDRLLSAYYGRTDFFINMMYTESGFILSLNI